MISSHFRSNSHDTHERENLLVVLFRLVAISLPTNSECTIIFIALRSTYWLTWTVGPPSNLGNWA
jgi:hypothetical protein